jgi:hypothetical protein
MEYFGSNENNPFEVCLRELHNSDLYVGIVGFRYGAIHSEYQKSYTEAEYDYAQEIKKPCLIFLASDDSKGELIINHGEYLLSKDKLNAFRDKLSKKHTVSFFRNKEELLNKFLTTLYNNYPHLLPQEVALPSFEEFQKIIDSHPAPRMAYELENIISEEKCLNTLEDSIGSISELFEYIVEDLEKLPEDLKKVWRSKGHEIQELEEIPYYLNPFENRLWAETHIGFHNHLYNLKMLKSILEYYYLSRKLQLEPSNKVLNERFEMLKSSLKELFSSGFAD